MPCLSLTHRSPQINDELNHQFEAVCESVFGEVESQAVEALDLPGCFRMRSHSYLRAIQAGCSQDDDCLSLFSMSAPPGPPITSSILKPSTCESQGVVRVWLRDGPPHLPACSPGHLPRAAAALLLSLDPYSARHRAGLSVLLVAQSQSGGCSVSPAPICHSFLPCNSVPISAPCWVLQQCGQCRSGVFSNPQNWPNSPSELQPGSNPA